jgi:CII-binding regulator of phage lambda lysogenization HflD
VQVGIELEKSEEFVARLRPLSAHLERQLDGATAGGDNSLRQLANHYHDMLSRTHSPTGIRGIQCKLTISPDHPFRTSIAVHAVP